MRSIQGIARLGIAVLTAGVAACASAPKQSAAPSAPPPAVPTADERAIAAASAEFDLGREAALAGDFVCARYRFSRAIDAVRPPTGPPPSNSVESFSFEMYEGIQRYEALAGPTEEAGTSSGEIDPEIEAQIEAPETNPEAIATAREAVASDRPAAVPDVPIVVNDSVLRVIAAFQSDALHDKIQAGLVRSGRYLPMIHRVFAEEGLPQDLAMIAFIESSFLPLARSNKMAHGIWQFMPRTGRQYGLRSNGIVDERRDFEKSTRAAARYLAYLNEIFGDWYLAMAAYNAGEGKILRAMNRTGARDFWHLASTNAIRKQTKNYVPAFLASVLISKNPSHYGFVVVPDPPLEYDTVRLERSISLEDLSKASQFPLEDLQSLNPELLTLVTPQQPEGYDLRIPDGTRRDAIARRRRRSHDERAGVQDARREEGRHASQDRPTLRRDGLISGVGELALDTRTAVPRPGNHGSREGREGQEDREGLDPQSRGRDVEEDDEVRTPGASDREELPREDRGHPLPDRPPARNDRGRDPGHQRPRRLRADQAGGQAQDPGELTVRALAPRTVIPRRAAPRDPVTSRAPVLLLP